MNFEGIDDAVPEDVGHYILSFLDVPTLVQKKAVCRSWKAVFTNTIRQKALPPKAFQSYTELKGAVGKSLRYNLVDAEEFAQTYGWPIGRWDVSHVEDFSYLFARKVSFNENIASWNVSNATNMLRMFDNASEFNQDLSSWNVSNVTSMGGMFWNACEFNQDLSTWNVSNVTNMMFMFNGASNFNQAISSWIVSNVTTTSSMFHGASNFNQDISSWDVSNVTEMPFMFHGASNFNQDISSWDVSNVTNMHGHPTLAKIFLLGTYRMTFIKKSVSSKQAWSK
eukprot:scaffold206506_cov55-Attheya_sp.AAC.1